jgi:hypothetical protein
MSAYQTTAVPTHKSQDAIRRILQSHEVRGVQFTEDFESRRVDVKFAKIVNGNLRTVSVSMVVPEAPVKKRRRSYRMRYGRIIYDKTPQEKQEQMARATYRALHYWLKSQFEAVDFGLLSFEDVFLAHFEWMVEGKRTTIGKTVLPYLSQPALAAPKLDEIVDGDVVETRPRHEGTSKA